MRHAQATPAKPAARRRTTRALAAGAALLATLLVAVIGVGYVFLAGQSGIDFVVRQLGARSGGALEIDGATGSLFDTVRIRHLTWRGSDTTVSARDVALTWSPVALLSRGIVVRGLGARQVAFEAKASTEDLPLPDDLTLPIEVRIERLGVGQIDWRVGANGGTIRGLAFSYAGGAAGHRFSDVTFVTAIGAITGDANVGGGTPFSVSGRLKARGDAALAGTDADFVLGGTLAELTLDGGGNTNGARFTGRVSLAPLAAFPLRGASLDASGIDLSAWNAALPATSLAVAVRAQPADGAISGTLEASNALPGSIDVGRAPLRTLASRFTLRDDALTLDSIDVALAGDGALAGHGRIPLGAAGAAGSWTVDVRDVDLRKIYAPLVATRLSGTLAADLGARRQQIRGDVADRTLIGGVALDFGAVIESDSLVVERFRARSGKGELAGRGRIAFSGERTFDLDATALRFDPARYGAFPAGALDGRIAVAGRLAPAWRVRAELALAPGSRLSGVALAGTARATIERDSVRDAAIDLAAGRAKLRVAGGAGEASERITVALDAPNLADLAPFVPAAMAASLSGGLHAKATISGLPPRAGIDLEASGKDLKLPVGIAFGTLAVQARIAPGSAAEFRDDLAARKIALEITATGFVTPAGSYGSLRASVGGTLAQHDVTLALKGEDIDASAAAHGRLDLPRESAAAASWAWNGTIDALENRGPWAMRLAAPASVQLAPARARVGATRLDLADGSVRLGEFAWIEGRIKTDGTLAGVPLAAMARFAGKPLPFGSTVTFGGQWSLTAAPRLNGSVSLRRETGDVFLARGADTDTRVAAGLTALEAQARFDDDAIHATALLRSSRGDRADATLTVGAVADAPPGHLAAEAPLEFAATADMPSLQVLQPWIGSTAVVSGRAHLDVAARGTVGRAVLSGGLVGEQLRIDAPRYGLHFTNGRVVARAADGRIAVEEIKLDAGAGTFRASGEIAKAASSGTRPLVRFAWHAERFRVFNRPDLRLVVAGEGTAAMENGKIVLTGKLRADEGAITYVAAPESVLGDDVVIKGRPRRGAEPSRAVEAPLEIDLTLDLGNRLAFSGEGLETGLAGTVRVTSGRSGLLGQGSIRTVRGTYYAFGQRLAIDRGRLIFDGPLDNPGLDILALRKNLAVEAGVTVTGTVKVPVIQLTSNPPVPDSEKLSWLITGQAPDRTSGTDYAALQAASAALLGSHGKPVSATLAQRVGLDDIAFKSGAGTQGGQSGATGAETQVVAVGKRLSDRLSVVYEQGLTVATNALRIEYALTRSLTLRAEAGTVGGVGIYFRRSFD
jgi:translocation and assembly module TamB